MKSLRGLTVAAALALAGCMPPAETGLSLAMRNYPPMIIGSNTDPVAGPVVPRACPAPGGVVEQKGGPTFEYFGASPGQPALCRMRVGGESVEGWYGIWLTAWPGHERAYAALTRAMQGGTGTVDGFDVLMGAGYHFHDLIRNEGVETIQLLGVTYRAIKLSHYREGFDGNGYRSVSTIWKDLPSGLLIYGTYQHIAGKPELDDPLIPTRIAPSATSRRTDSALPAKP